MTSKKWEESNTIYFDWVVIGLLVNLRALNQKHVTLFSHLASFDFADEFS